MKATYDILISKIQKEEIKDMIISDLMDKCNDYEEKLLKINDILKNKQAVRESESAYVYSYYSGDMKEIFNLLEEMEE